MRIFSKWNECLHSVCMWNHKNRFQICITDDRKLQNVLGFMRWIYKFKHFCIRMIKSLMAFGFQWISFIWNFCSIFWNKKVGTFKFGEIVLGRKSAYYNLFDIYNSDMVCVLYWLQQLSVKFGSCVCIDDISILVCCTRTQCECDLMWWDFYEGHNLVNNISVLGTCGLNIWLGLFAYWLAQEDLCWFWRLRKKDWDGGWLACLDGWWLLLLLLWLYSFSVI